MEEGLLKCSGTEKSLKIPKKAKSSRGTKLKKEK